MVHVHETYRFNQIVFSLIAQYHELIDIDLILPAFIFKPRYLKLQFSSLSTENVSQNLWMTFW